VFDNNIDDHNLCNCFHPTEGRFGRLGGLLLVVDVLEVGGKSLKIVVELDS